MPSNTMVKNKSSVDALYYVNRETGLKETEIVYGEKELFFLYRYPIGRYLRRLLVRRRWFSQINAIPKKIRWSKRKIRPFIERYGVDAQEAEKPLNQYRCLDEFFTRRLRSGARPVDHNVNYLVSPADGRVTAYTISNDLKMRIKGQNVSIQRLTGNLMDSNALKDGSAMVIRLAPKDYHRFHFPVDSVVSATTPINGALESVHPIALDAGSRSFENKRTFLELPSRTFGSIYMIEVGALTVGTIVQTYQPGAIQKAQEKGYFRFGGSTIVLLWGKKGPVVDPDITANTEAGMETLVKCGTRIASINGATR